MKTVCGIVSVVVMTAVIGVAGCGKREPPAPAPVVVSKDTPAPDVTPKAESPKLELSKVEETGTVKFETALKGPKTVVNIDGSEYRLADLDKELKLRTGEHRLEVKVGRRVLQARTFTLNNGQRIILELYDPERKVAEWAVQLGGLVDVVDDGGRVVRLVKGKPLSDEHFQVKRVYLGGHGKAAGSDWTMLKDLQAIEVLGMEGTGIDDVGLEALKGLKTLNILALSRNVRVTDAGLVHVQSLKGLEELYLSYSAVTDEGLQHLRDLTLLKTIQLDGNKLTGAGLAHLKGMTKLARLNLPGTQATDAGLMHLKGLAALQELNLARTKVTDAGVADLLKALPKLIVHRK